MNQVHQKLKHKSVEKTGANVLHFFGSDTYNPVPGVMEGVPASRDYDGGFATKLMVCVFKDNIMLRRKHLLDFRLGKQSAAEVLYWSLSM